MPPTPCFFPCLAIALLLALGHVQAADASEAVLITAARTPGPGQSKALSKLGDQTPEDAAAVASVLVDGVLSKDVACRIHAGRAIASLLTSGEDNLPFRTALATHAGRLLTAAESGMSDRINPPLEALAGIETPSGAMTTRLIALLAPGKGFRRYTVGALARSRPLTPEIKRAVLAEAGGSALTQQDLVIAMQTWSAADLVGDDIDRALVVLFDTVMGNIPPRIVDILKQRGLPSPIVAARLMEILSNPSTADWRYRDALAAYSASAADSEEMALIGRLLASDPRQDPDRASCVLRHLEGRRGLAPAILTRLTGLVQDKDQNWWLRTSAARILVDSDAGAGIAAQVTELGELPAWIIEVDSAPGWPIEDVDRGLAKAAGSEERLAWTLAKLLKTELAAHESDKDFNQRRGAIQIACISRWVAEHPDSAGMPYVVCRTLEGYTGNYAPTAEERMQCTAYVTRLLASGACNEAAMADVRYPQGGPGEMSRKVYDALAWAYTPDTKATKGATAQPPLLVARFEAARHLHASKAPPRLLLRADRELASSLRSQVREHRQDPAIFRDMLTTCGFSAMPVEAFMAELKALSSQSP